MPKDVWNVPELNWIAMLSVKLELFLIGALATIPDSGDELWDWISNYKNSHDTLVRAQAFTDDYKCVRKEALKLIYQIKWKSNGKEVRLIDEAFGKVCSKIQERAFENCTSVSLSRIVLIERWWDAVKSNRNPFGDVRRDIWWKVPGTDCEMSDWDILEMVEWKRTFHNCAEI